MEERLTEKENEQMWRAVEESRAAFEEEKTMDSCTSYEEFKSKLRVGGEWTVIHRPDESQIIHVPEISTTTPQIKCSVTVDRTLTVSASLEGVKLLRIKDFEMPMKMDTMSRLDEILLELLKLVTSQKVTGDGSDEADLFVTLGVILGLLQPFLLDSTRRFYNVLWFVYEQISNLCRQNRPYTSEFLVFSSLLYNISPTAYLYLRETGHCLLPSYSTIRRLTLNQAMSPAMEQDENYFLFYIRQKFKSLSEIDKTVILLLDEIHLQPFYDFKAGSIVRAAHDSARAATTAFVFMMTSVFSKFKDVVHILPSSAMVAETLFGMIKKTVLGLERIGFKVIAVITDNNAISAKAMSFFKTDGSPALQTKYKHPADKTRPLFFMFDSVHIMKCVRNNWLNLKNYGRCFVVPKFSHEDIVSKSILKASFNALRRLLNIESGKLVKFSYTLSWKALEPSSLERQKVSLALQVFNAYVAQALTALGPSYNIANFQGTSLFIRIVTRWWSIVNVKTPGKGIRFSDEFQKPLSLGPSQAKSFLKYFLEWLVRWDLLNRTGTLTRETFTALHHTTKGLLELAEYVLSDLGAKYVLLGKFQTDSLEARFGQYRQLSGGNYHVSLRQIFESEKKLRTMSVLKLKMNNVEVDLKEFSFPTELDENEKSDFNPIEIEPVTVEDYESTESCLPVLTYLAGYCAFKIDKTLDCESCHDNLTMPDADSSTLANSYISGLTRGGMLYPGDDLVKVAQTTYIITNKLIAKEEFLCVQSQHSAIVDLTLEALAEERCLGDDSSDCPNGHSALKLRRMTSKIVANALLNNYTRELNEGSLRVKKKRKLQTLTK